MMWWVRGYCTEKRLWWFRFGAQNVKCPGDRVSTVVDSKEWRQP
jgi:hypothetical protein